MQCRSLFAALVSRQMCAACTAQRTISPCTLDASLYSKCVKQSRKTEITKNWKNTRTKKNPENEKLHSMPGIECKRGKTYCDVSIATNTPKYPTVPDIRLGICTNATCNSSVEMRKKRQRDGKIEENQRTKSTTALEDSMRSSAVIKTYHVFTYAFEIVFRLSFCFVQRLYAIRSFLCDLTKCTLHTSNKTYAQCL